MTENPFLAAAKENPFLAIVRNLWSTVVAGDHVVVEWYVNAAYATGGRTVRFEGDVITIETGGTGRWSSLWVKLKNSSDETLSCPISYLRLVSRA